MPKINIKDINFINSEDKKTKIEDYCKRGKKLKKRNKQKKFKFKK